eukprot:403339732
MEQTQKEKNLNFYAVSWPEHDFLDLKSCQDNSSKLMTSRYPFNKSLNEQEKPKAIIVLFHGLGSHMQRYIYIAKMFADAGYDVVGYDSLGFGSSEGERGMIHSMENYQQDGYNFIMKVQEYYAFQYKENSIPILAFGYSLGSRVAISCSRLQYLKDQSQLFNAFLFHAPAFGRLNRDPNYEQEVKETCKTEPMKIMRPPTFTPPNEDYTFLSTPSPDPLVFLGPWTALSQREFMEIPDYIKDYYQNISIPIYCAFAIKDSAVSNEEGEKALKQVLTPKDKIKVSYYDSEHVFLYNGQVYENVISEEIQWINQIL